VIINGLRTLGLDPVFVYNTNGYDKAETIRSLENYIDVYLPDFKYADAELGKLYSDVKDYPTVALEAIREMVRQKGTDLQVNERGYATRGVIIRHLVLPSHPKNSIKVLETIESELSNRLHISLMAQYYPTYKAGHHESIGRTVRPGEYKMVVRELEYLGFENGWVQELSSHDSYRPDFESEKHPFE
jgi:putative pyruvate formate lyase activating enzyme